MEGSLFIAACVVIPENLIGFRLMETDKISAAPCSLMRRCRMDAAMFGLIPAVIYQRT